jgi:uncharacterized protein (TIGR03083 family)
VGCVSWAPELSAIAPRVVDVPLWRAPKCGRSRPAIAPLSSARHHGRVLDVAQAYEGVHVRLLELLADRTGEEPVACCPGWTVRDVVAHLTGLCEDWVEGRLDGYASDAWTARQVARFAHDPLVEILARWGSVFEAFLALPDDPVMGPPGRWAFGDAIVHEADIRGAIGAERVPSEAVALALKGSIARWRQVVADWRLPTLLLRCPDLREWWLGDRGDLNAIVAEAPSYEVFRALAGRRSVDQVRSWSWSDDPSPYIAAGLPYPFSLAATPLSD